MQKLKLFFAYPLWKYLFFAVAIIFAVLLVYDIAALDIIRVGCIYYDGPIHTVLSYAFTVDAILLLILFLIVFINVLLQKDWKFLIKITIILVLGIAGFVFMISNNIFYCFFNGGISLDGFYWGPH